MYSSGDNLEKANYKSKDSKDLRMEEENKFKTIAIKIWPTIYRIINSFIYFLISLIKTVASIAINQIKGGKSV